MNTAGAKVGTKSVSTIGPYTITFISVTYAGGKSTWSYQVQRTGPAQGNGLSHLIFSLGCATSSQVTGGTVDGKPYSNLAFSEGNGTGCMTTGSILKFDNLPSGLSDGGIHLFTFTLSTTPDVAEAANVWVKAGRSCYQSTLSGPGCESVTTYRLGGRMEIRYCMGTINEGQYAGQTGAYGIHVAGIPVQLVRADKVVVSTVMTDKDGYYAFTNVAPGTYTVKVDTDTYNSTAKGCNNKPIIPIIHVDAMVGALTIPSSDFEMHKDMVDFWLDTFQPGTCGPDIVDGSNWTRGSDPYHCP
ncbi:SdrD B-like domain-containing protein [Spirosoma rigui]|uniref:SdrD B-like domain-containing protein n=1 Tax=Spirosoma rigui TaxID=564064 RepID=UPI001473ABFF|nr:SdrD B-like domain-containing protein [Spirosoma rigui]